MLPYVNSAPKTQSIMQTDGLPWRPLLINIKTVKSELDEDKHADTNRYDDYIIIY